MGTRTYRCIKPSIQPEISKYTEWEKHVLQHTFASPSNQWKRIEQDRKFPKMKGSARFILYPPNAGPGPKAEVTSPAAGAGGAVQHAEGEARVVPLPSWIPYVADLETHTQRCLVGMVGVDSADMEK